MSLLMSEHIAKYLYKYVIYPAWYHYNWYKINYFYAIDQDTATYLLKKYNVSTVLLRDGSVRFTW